MDLENYESRKSPDPSSGNTIFNFNSMKNLFDILHKETVNVKQFIIQMNDIISKAKKLDYFKSDFRNWFDCFLESYSNSFVNNIPIIHSLYNLFSVLFDQQEDSSSFLVKLMEKNESCFIISVEFFNYYYDDYRKKEGVLINYDIFDNVIKNIFNSLGNPNLRSSCISVISENLTNSYYCFKKLDFSFETNVADVFPFLCLTDPPNDVQAGLNILMQLIDTPIQRFSSNEQYFVFFQKVIYAINYLVNEEIVSDKVIFLISEISLKMKTLSFFYLMDPNDLLFTWLLSMFILSQRFFNQESFLKKSDLIENLIQFWLLPPNFVKIKNQENYINWRGEFLEMFKNCIMTPSKYQEEIISQMFEDVSSNFFEFFGKYYSYLSPEEFSSCYLQNLIILDEEVVNLGKSAVIAIFSEVLKARMLIYNLDQFLENDSKMLHGIVSFFQRLPLAAPQNNNDLLFSDSISRVLISFNDLYFKSGKFSITKTAFQPHRLYSQIIDDITYLFIRNLTNCQVDDSDYLRLSKCIDSLNIPNFILETLSYDTNFVGFVKSLKFQYLPKYPFSLQVKKIHNLLFSLQNNEIDYFLLSNAQNLSVNSMTIVNSALNKCINLSIIIPTALEIINKSLSSNISLDKIAKTLIILSRKNWLSLFSNESIEYVHLLIQIASNLMGQFESAESDEKIVITSRVLVFLKNLLANPSFNFGVMEMYGDYSYNIFVNNFFSFLHQKTFHFFCQSIDFVSSLIYFFDELLHSGLILTTDKFQQYFNFTLSVSNIDKSSIDINQVYPIMIFNQNFSMIPNTIFDLQKLNASLLELFVNILNELIRKGVQIPQILPNILNFKQTTNLSVHAFDDFLFDLIIKYHEVFIEMLESNNARAFIKPDDYDLYDYITNELANNINEIDSDFRIDLFELIHRLDSFFSSVLLKE